MPERTTRELFLGEGAGTGAGSQHLYVNVGPAHPAMHGIIRILAELDGETVVKADVEIGYLHRAFEKECEGGPYNNAIPYTDRLNYVSPLINNFGYASCVEKLLGIDATERCQYIRVIMSEISRICDHLTCIGASAMELGAFTVFLYMIKAREYLWELVEDVTGARLTISRVCDHLTCIGASAMELGAFTVFLYMIKAREFLWELVEDVTGARLTIS